MPYLRLETSAKTTDETRQKLCELLSKAVAKDIGKPEKYVMVSVGNAAMALSGSAEPTVFADVRSIGGLNKSVNQALAASVCAIVKDKLGIPGDRVYLNFSDVPGSNWGCNGSTFG